MALYSRKAAPDWSAGDDLDGEAKCRKFPTPHTAGSDAWFDDMEHAADVCNGTTDGIVCPMRASCLVQALTNCERFGCWGGLNQQQLGWMRKKFRQTPEKWSLEHAPPLGLFSEGE
ncbi:WhiB family transcriptional regulator [Streptomyces sp. H27-C3]|uniref:WhiB family transcriptional regulator n=1 Tax=Streptomyces sp. H27-C3 TaxID=3046305 RepID=UPI0024BB873B|nr:WhiB family transcriptional regulator [Streptomyces sp. H27-C3]MDJ0463169.1 WhiB family transcriptional regulator [Streptomyces sp. H27-C3]